MFHRWSLRLEAKAGGVIELALYDVIGEGVTAQDVLSQIQAQRPSEIRILINSAGGSVTEGMAIYSLLTEERKKGTRVTARIDGLCASIATLIALAADSIEMAEGAYWMIHEPSAGGGSGTAGELRQTADLLDRMREQMLSVYAAKTGKPVQELAAMCAAETWFTAAEAKAAGFVQSVIPSQALAAQWDLKPFNRVPKALGEIRMTEEECKAMQAENAALKAKLAELESKMAKAAADAEAKAEGDEDDSDPEKPDTDTEDPEGKASAVVAVAQMITGIKDIEALPGALMALQTKAKGATGAKAKHAERVAQAIADGKLMPSQKAWAMAATTKAFDAYLTSIGDNVIVPVGQHHEPNEAEAKARSGAAGQITLSADEQKLAKLMQISPEKFLAKKRETIAS